MTIDLPHTLSPDLGLLEGADDRIELLSRLIQILRICAEDRDGSFRAIPADMGFSILADQLVGVLAQWSINSGRL